MRWLRHRAWRATAVIVGIALVCLAPMHVQAAKVSSTKTEDKSGVSIFPLRSYPSQKPGETTTATIKIANLSTERQEVTLTSEKFLLTNEDYDYRFVESKQNRWVSFSDNKISLATNETRAVAYSLAVPSSASPGGYYLSVLATTRDQSSKTNIVAERRVASLIFLQVAGKLKHQTNLLSVDVPWLTLDRSLTVQSHITNQGNIHERARLPITIERWPGHQNITSTQVGSLIMPSTTRKLSATLLLPYMPGIYKVRTTLAPPQGGIVEKHRYVFYVPLLPILCAILVIFVYLLLRNIKKQQRNNPHKPTHD